MKLFHGTSQENHEQIIAEGRLLGPVFLTPSKQSAKEYAGREGAVIEVDVDEDTLGVDFDLPGARILSVEEANSYTGNEWTIQEYIDNGNSVASLQDVKI
ncbi:hypothetical protein A203_18595 [Chromobacterium violaceum]|uniref:hypothetical protein n=1 Tax=Chromobacterium violaceum TaxID=536 RepID=UPI00385F8998